MATGAAPALEQKPDTESKGQSEAKPVTLKERIVRALTKIFQHNEDLGVTRHS